MKDLNAMISAAVARENVIAARLHIWVETLKAWTRPCKTPATWEGKRGHGGLSQPREVRSTVEKNQGKPAILLGFSTVFSERQQTTLLCRASLGYSEISNRFVMHDFRAENSIVLWESRTSGRSQSQSLE